MALPLALGEHLALAAEETRLAFGAPLSRRRALRAAVLVDALADRVFEATRGAPQAVRGAEDLPQYRRRLAEESAALGILAQFTAMGPDAPRLEMASWPVPDTELAALGIEDFMVSLYNGQQVQRVVFAWPDGRRRLAHEVLAEALAFWQGQEV